MYNKGVKYPNVETLLQEYNLESFGDSSVCLPEHSKMRKNLETNRNESGHGVGKSWK